MTHPTHPSPTRPVPLLDVCRGHQALREQIMEAVARVVDSGRFLYGEDVEALEREVSALCGTRNAVGCASGSDALLLSMMALAIGPGDEVIVPSFTFFATASAVSRLGGTPVFVDIDPVTFNLDPEALADAITPQTKAIIPVHLFGQCADMEAICEVAQRRGLAVVEDAAQAIGSKCQDKAAGSWGRMGCFSFYPTKNLGGFGDGGMITTDCDQTAARLRILACHGMQPRYYHSEVGVNSRLDSLQAAILRVKLTHLQSINESRRANAQRYHQLLHSSAHRQAIVLPREVAGRFHVWNQYTVRASHGSRDALRSHLQQQNIGAEIYYPVPLHLQECFRYLGYRPGSLPHTEQAAQEVLSLPIFGELTERELQTVAAAVQRFTAQHTRAA